MQNSLASISPFVFSKITAGQLRDKISDLEVAHRDAFTSMSNSTKELWWSSDPSIQSQRKIVISSLNNIWDSVDKLAVQVFGDAPIQIRYLRLMRQGAMLPWKGP